ncbi:MAG: hypothetical protein R2752_18065 [Vicinamibacterales bacterium]
MLFDFHFADLVTVGSSSSSRACWLPTTRWSAAIMVLGLPRDQHQKALRHGSSADLHPYPPRRGGVPDPIWPWVKLAGGLYPP